MDNDRRAEKWELADGTKLILRHISPADAAREKEFVHKLSPQSSYLRFHGTLKDLSTKDLKRFTEPDSQNEGSLIVLHSEETGQEEIGEARYVIDSEQSNCEFAIVVADRWQRRGIGTRLMNALIRYLQACGVKQLYGSVLKSNLAMRKFSKHLGFSETNTPDDSSTLLVIKQLD
jgi:acetyltransferase